MSTTDPITSRPWADRTPPECPRISATAVAQQASVFLDAAPDAMLITDERGQVVFVNPQAERLFGYRREALLGASIETLVPMALRPQHAAHRRLYQAAPRARVMGHGLALTAQRQDGTVFASEISLSPLHTAAGTFVICAIRDGTAPSRPVGPTFPTPLPSLSRCR